MYKSVKRENGYVLIIYNDILIHKIINIKLSQYLIKCKARLYQGCKEPMAHLNKYKWLTFKNNKIRNCTRQVYKKNHQEQNFKGDFRKLK